MCLYLDLFVYYLPPLVLLQADPFTHLHIEVHTRAQILTHTLESHYKFTVTAPHRLPLPVTAGQLSS